MKKFMLILLLGLIALTGYGEDKFHRERRITISRETIDGHDYIVYWNSIEFEGVGGIVHNAACGLCNGKSDTLMVWHKEAK